CGGTNLDECTEIINNMRKMGVFSILDFSVEALESEDDFDLALKKKIQIIKLTKDNDSIPFTVFKPTSFGRYDLFKKVSSNISLNNYEKEEWMNVRKRFSKICEYAKESNMKILIDAEEYEVQKSIDDLALEMMKNFNTKSTVVYNTIQLYRFDRISYIESLLTKFKKAKFKFGFKLVRGAYLEKERELAILNGYKSPICASKKETDKNFNDCISLVFKNKTRIDLFIASHNEESNLIVINKIKKYSLNNDDSGIWFGQLYGMGDHISYNLAKNGFNVAKILPFGPVENLIPYLIRRAQENSSFEGQSNRELVLINRELFRRN
ncbi:proline dehydrogenase family protein, partial [Flavobacteriales bacterium]|nr:proline dehydrogenase family protein [Flavobacteriales bacterium]